MGFLTLTTLNLPWHSQAWLVSITCPQFLCVMNYRNAHHENLVILGEEGVLMFFKLPDTVWAKGCPCPVCGPDDHRQPRREEGESLASSNGFGKEALQVQVQHREVLGFVTVCLVVDCDKAEAETCWGVSEPSLRSSNPCLLKKRPPPNSKPVCRVLMLGSPSKVVLASPAGEF